MIKERELYTLADRMGCRLMIYRTGDAGVLTHTDGMKIGDLTFDTDSYVSIKWYKGVRKYHSFLVAQWENWVHNKTFLTKNEFDSLMIEAEKFMDDKNTVPFRIMIKDHCGISIV